MCSRTIQQTLQCLDVYDLLLENQSAYRKHYSCETSLLKMTNDILWNMENKLVTAVMLLDLSATIDTVDHDILLEVLCNKFEIDRNALKWYNYLELRKFKVNIYKAYSTERTMQFSMLQGLVQGAFLFIAYTSTFSEVIKDLTMLKVKSWMDFACLKLNESKTEFIYIGCQHLL